MIRFGLGAINGVGHKAVAAILAARTEGGRFRDLYDFCDRVDLGAVNKAVIEALVKAGAFDSTGAMRKALSDVLEQAIDAGAQAQRDKQGGQMDMFGVFTASAPSSLPPIGTGEWSDAEMLAHEKATLGFFITKHPLARYEEIVRTFSSATTVSLRALADGAGVMVGGLISKLRAVPIKQGRSAGKKMLIVTLEDFAGSIEGIVFPDQLAELQPLLKPDAVVFVDGSVDKRREEPSLRITRIIPIEAARRELSKQILVRISSIGGPHGRLMELRDLCRHYRGRCPLYLEIASPQGWVAMVKGREGVAVDPTDEFLGRAQLIAGSQSVFCVGPTRVCAAGT